MTDLVKVADKIQELAESIGKSLTPPWKEGEMESFLVEFTKDMKCIGASFRGEEDFSGLTCSLLDRLAQLVQFSSWLMLRQEACRVLAMANQARTRASFEVLSREGSEKGIEP